MSKKRIIVISSSSYLFNVENEIDHYVLNYNFTSNQFIQQIQQIIEKHEENEANPYSILWHILLISNSPQIKQIMRIQQLSYKLYKKIPFINTSVWTNDQLILI